MKQQIFSTDEAGLLHKDSSVQFSSVPQSHPTLCDPMNCSTPGLPVHYQLPEFTHIHVHCKKAKWLSEEAVQIAEKRREVKGKRERERYTQLNTEFQRITRRHKKVFLSEQYKEVKENNGIREKLEISSRNSETPRENFMQRYAL